MKTAIAFVEKGIKDGQEIIVSSAKDARRLANHIISKGRWFYHQRMEGEHHFVFAESWDLDEIRRKLPALDYRLPP